MAPRQFAVFGDPVGHSLSPAMHSAAFAAMGLPHRYEAVHVARGGLREALETARLRGLSGVNLTVPHKVAAAELMDALTAEAGRIGAVNTVTLRRGRIEGHNTDGIGFVRALEQLRGTKPVRAAVLGSGGAARAVIDGLAAAYPDCEVEWVSRAPERLRTHARVVARGYSEWSSSAAPLDLLANATTVGMHAGPLEWPCALPLARVSARTRVVDLVYPRPSGGLLDMCAAVGAQVQDGREMLLWQGVLALEHWLEIDVPEPAVSAMRDAIG